MTQKEEQLLLVDLCAKLSYGLLVKETLYSDSEDIYPPDRYPTEESKACMVMSVQGNCVTLHVSPLGWKPEVMELRHIKPYLRPMSSMTEEEREEFRTLILPEASCAYEDCLEWDAQIIGGGYLQISVEDFSNVTDWLNAHHFDYRNLIERGLALEATEGMYKTE